MRCCGKWAWLRITMGVLCCIALTACGENMGQIPGQQADEPVLEVQAPPAVSPQAAEPEFGEFLGAPSELARTTSVPSYPARHNDGSAWQVGMPNQHVFNFGSNAEFTASHDQATATDTSGLAYAVYQFSTMDGYDEDEGMSLSFSEPPADYATVWLGMSDWASDTWDWFFIPTSGYVETPGIADYISGTGELLAVVVLAAEDSCKLEWIIVGERLGIEVWVSTNLNSDPAQNVAPMTVDFDASGTFLYGGDIVSFDFDWEADGTYDIEGNTDGVASHDYIAYGGYQCNVRAFDDIGRSEVWGVEFYLVNPANTPPVADLQFTDVGGAAPRTVDLDANGTTDDSGIMWYEWDFDDDGMYELGFMDGGPAETHIFGNSGSNWVTVRVTDWDFATDTAQVNIALLNGFNHVTVSSGIHVASQIQLENCGTFPNFFPTIAFEDYTNNDLKVSKATSAFGSGWGAVVDAAPAGEDTGHNPSLIAGAVGRPLVVYGKRNGNNTYTLQSVYANNSAFTTWTSPTNIRTDEVISSHSALTRVNNWVVVAAVGGLAADDRNTVYYHTALNDMGAAWAPEVEVYNEPVSGYLSGLAIHPAQSGLTQWPVISYGRGKSGENPDVWQIVSAAADDGSSWAAPISHEGYYVSATSFLTLTGMPSIVGGNETSNGAVSFMRASVEDGTAWPATPDEVVSGGHGGWCDMQLVNGVPAVCYYALDGSDLWYITATDALGTSWNEPFIVASGGVSGGIVGKYCSMITRGGTAPIIVYYDHYPKEVKVAYWL